MEKWNLQQNFEDIKKKNMNKLSGKGTVALEAKPTPALSHDQQASNEAMLGHAWNLSFREDLQLGHVLREQDVPKASGHVLLEHVCGPCMGAGWLCKLDGCFYGNYKPMSGTKSNCGSGSAHPKNNAFALVLGF